ncbi:Ras-related protein [Schistosoma japonicum]|uniref:Ras-related protein n=1 Tax=Schistosoma japonicum TaxID=6182 RepID=Q5DAL3_SCHJA|nr:SJCHGC06676 protein [Schistosoma japonicum]KAH8875172.1 Ras-related protein Rab-4A [Schistosoma japonicum]KAH8875173.1 Ras-related protein Rab-4A [Schistosoma japonicum]TNN10681.1 Ras-related protein [Schistosoma japonicum]CAX69589.1 Ras-related protein Rab-4A [Schistosoma japonicum]
MAMERYDYLLKFLIIGNSAAGKTCLMRWFLEGKFKQDSLHTIGVEFGTKILRVDSKSVKLQIWDTAGQERFQCITRSYYRGAACALVVYDITDRGSFNAVNTWISTIRELARQDLTIILIGNKVDLASSREVTELEGKQCAIDNGVHTFLETSAKNGLNVLDAFTAAVRSALEQIQNSSNPSQISYPVGIGPAQLTLPGSNESLGGKTLKQCCRS